MKLKISYFLALIITLSIIHCTKHAQKAVSSTETGVKEVVKVIEDNNIIYPQEKHFKNLTQLTFGGDNAEAYWSFDQSMFVFQSNHEDWGLECDQIFIHKLEDKQKMKDEMPKMVSTGKGRTTCSYFMPGDSTILYASTHLGGDACPEAPERHPGGKYLWPVYSTFDIFVADLEGNIVKQLTHEPGYDAEATVSPDGSMIVFTSDRTGDLELYTMDIHGENVKQITSGLGYDGGAFFSPDGSKLVFRSSRPTSPEDVKEYKDYLAMGLVAPTSMEIYVCNVDGSDLVQVTKLGKANWAPFFHPSGEKILFASNHAGMRGFEFNLYMIDIDGSNLEKVSHDGVFDAFPMFSPDGKQLLFSSNRNNGGNHDTNLFLAEWVD